MPLPQEIAAKAEAIVNSLTRTDYQHKRLLIRCNEVGLMAEEFETFAAA